MTLRFIDRPAFADDALPNFLAPPVSEVSLGIQFDTLNNYNSLSVAKFHDEIAREYPLVQERPPLGSAFETFGSGDVGLMMAQIRFVPPGQLEHPRIFLLKGDQSELVQVQPTRLHFNWRAMGKEANYPRYPHLREEYDRILGKFSNWSDVNGFGKVSATQCEIVYVNRIPLCDQEGTEQGLTYFFPWLTNFNAMTEDGSIQFRFRLLGDDGQPNARLTFSLNYGPDHAGKREARLELLVRGRPKGNSANEILEFFDEGRKVIVNHFTEMTSPKAHQIWKRT